MAHTCRDPNRATQCRAHSVAANSRSFRDVARVWRYTPPTVTKKTCRTYLATSLCQCRKEIALQKRIALHGGVAATLTPIALHCATKARRGAVGASRRSQCLSVCIVDILNTLQKLGNVPSINDCV